jgi:hypothetical protein
LFVDFIGGDGVDGGVKVKGWDFWVLLLDVDGGRVVIRNGGNFSWAIVV